MRSHLLLCLCFVLAIVSCRSTKTVTRDTYSLTSTTVHDTQVRFRDSYHTLIIQGDTVYQRDSIHDQVEVAIHDTVYIERSDSTYHEEKNQIQYRDRPLSRWNKAILTIGYLSILLLIGYIIYRITKFMLKLYLR